MWLSRDGMINIGRHFNSTQICNVGHIRVKEEVQGPPSHPYIYGGGREAGEADDGLLPQPKA